MHKAWIGLVGTMLLGAACGGAGPEPAAPETASSSPAPGASCARRHPKIRSVRLSRDGQGRALALVRQDGKTIAYVADEDGDALLSMDVDSGATRAVTPLAGAPAQVLVMADGRVAVSLRDQNRVQLLEPAGSDQPLEALCSVPTPAEPYGLALTPNDATLLVTSSWARRLTAYDADTLKRKYDKPLAREPRSVVVDDDGTRAFVTHVVGGKISVVDLEPEERDVREIDLRIPKLNRRTSKTELRSSCQGFALAKSIAPAEGEGLQDPEKPPLTLKTTPAPAIPKGRIFAPRVTIDPGEPSQRTSGYGNDRNARVESPIVSVIDAAAERTMTTALLAGSGRLDNHKGECLLPRSAAMSASSGGLLVTCVGTDVLVELDPRGADPLRLERRRWQVPEGPMGVAVDDAKRRAVVWGQFDRQLAVVDLRTDARSHSAKRFSAPAARKAKLSAAAEWGRRIFHKTDDNRISGDGRACASCHPDGREDQLTWSTPVGPRQTIMLAGRVKGSAPYSWLGVHESEKVHLKATFQRLGGSGLPDEHDATKVTELDALVAYLHEMPSPRMQGAFHDADETRLAQRGKELFFTESTGCANCHVSGKATDKRAHDIGTHTNGDVDVSFDTPSLAFVGGTAPYFHDGRFATLMDMLMATDSNMGHTMHLSRKDARALSAYLETL
jgi:DNA-binding beta-propeller fold protein YncE